MAINLDKKTIQSIIAASKQDQEKSKANYERQQGTINLCEWILINCDLPDSLEGEKGKPNEVPS